MEALWISLIVLGTLAIALLVFLFIIYIKCYYNHTKGTDAAYKPLSGEQYVSYDEEMKNLIKNVRALPYEDAWITSFDKKKLHARAYIKDPTKPFVILAHGYRGSGVRDFAGGLSYYLDKGFNAILIDQRGHEQSYGKTMTFGIKERKDVALWAKYVVDTYGKDVEILLTGISMGGATVLMALDQKLPSNVKCVISDCPFSSPIGIILKVIKDMHLPPKLCKPFMKLCARIFCHFNVEESDALRAVKGSSTPILIVHGTDDKYVPYEMSIDIQKANPNIELLLIEDAPHGLSFLKDNAKYISVANEFIKKHFDYKF